ncbi:hypothetical protein [Chitinivorax sp. B]|uniref:hypothetical protein n=1 Tax=Chitinivorax sp. B TaxID=2502235 RepID=UPI0010F6B940|nr:hypothetical protein [Chitinivorax sp. B]
MSIRLNGCMAAALATLYLSAPATAEPIFCTGKITQQYMNESGEFFIRPDWRNDWIQICNLNTEWRGISPQVCASFFAAAKTAVISKVRTTVAYWDRPGAPAPTACNIIPTYQQAPTPGYLMLIND